MITYNTFDFDFCLMINDIIDLYIKNNKNAVAFYLGEIPEEIVYGSRKLYIVVDGNRQNKDQIFFLLTKGMKIEDFSVIDYSSYNNSNYKSFKNVIFNPIIVIIRGFYKNNIVFLDDMKLTCNGLVAIFNMSVTGEINMMLDIDDNMKRYIEDRMR